jgi:type I restriction enzyme M protein
MPLSETDTKAKLIAPILHSWRGESGVCEYQEYFWLLQIRRYRGNRSHGYMLTPGRYVGVADIEGEDGPFEEKMARLKAKLEEQSREPAKLEAAVRRNFKEIWHG